MVKKIKQIFNKNKDNIPLTGGSLFSDIQRLETTETITLDSMKASFDKFTNRNNTNYYYWYVLNFHANYFANLFGVENVDDENLLQAILLTFRMYFYYGNAGIIVEENGGIIPVYEVESKVDKYGKLKYVKVGYSYDLVAQNVNAYQTPPKNIYTIAGDELDRYARIIGGENAFIKWLPFAKLQTELLTMINNHRYFLNKKMLINVNDVSNLKQETDAFFDINNPFIMNLDTDSINSNRFEVNGFSGNKETGGDLLSYYKFVVKTYYELLGRQTDSDVARGGTPQNVIQQKASMNNFETLTNFEYQFKNVFIKKLNQLLNTNIVLLRETKLAEANADSNFDSKKEVAKWTTKNS